MWSTVHVLWSTLSHANRTTKDCIEFLNILFHFRTVSVDELKRGLSLADPEIDNKTMEKYVLWVFDTTADQVGEVESLELSKVIDRLQNGNIRRSGRKF